VLLRLAVLLNRSRSSTVLPRMQVRVDRQTLTLGFPADWLAGHPLTLADLEMEAELLGAAGFGLNLR
jgi:exopolyphosphatase/guanosine-5'-triphosphate,3'-diphosphate pyrophosphatase